MPRPAVPGEFKVHQGKPVTIERVLELLETTLDGTTFVIADTGDALFATADITIPRTAEYMSSAYYASMGFAVPASLAVQLAFPDLRPIVIVGDGGSCCLPIGKPLSMTRVSAIVEAKLLSEQLPGAKANGRSIGLYPLLDVGDLMFEISDLSLVLVYFKPVLPVALQRRLDTLAYLVQLPLLGLQIAKERLPVGFHVPRQIEDDPV